MDEFGDRIIGRLVNDQVGKGAADGETTLAPAVFEYRLAFVGRAVGGELLALGDQADAEALVLGLLTIFRLVSSPVGDSLGGQRPVMGRGAIVRGPLKHMHVRGLGDDLRDGLDRR